MHGKPHCYFHAPQWLRAARPRKPRYFLELPVPGSRGALLAALREALSDIAAQRIETLLAGQLMYALQMALSRGNAPNRGEVSQIARRGLRIFKTPHAANLYSTVAK